MSDRAPHIPVMAEAVLSWLAVRPEGVYVDCTAGAGGHSSLIAARLDSGRLIALDRDGRAVALAGARLACFPRAEAHRANYGELGAVLAGLGVGAVDGVLIDAGMSSMQIDEAGRGFSFQEEGPLDMRMDGRQVEDAAGFLARVSVEELAGVLRAYGDVGPVKRIAASIKERQRSGRLGTTGALAAAVRDALDFVEGEPLEVRTVFQAIRMAVNEELRWLEAGLRAGIAALRPGGRLVAISFHSGEDRVVKRVLREASRKRRLLYPDGRIRGVEPAEVRLLTRKPAPPTEAEIRENSRAKSAKLRAVERV